MARVLTASSLIERFLAVVIAGAGGMIFCSLFTLVARRAAGSLAFRDVVAFFGRDTWSFKPVGRFCCCPSAVWTSACAAALRRADRRRKFEDPFSCCRAPPAAATEVCAGEDDGCDSRIEREMPARDLAATNRVLADLVTRFVFCGCSTTSRVLVLFNLDDRRTIVIDSSVRVGVYFSEKTEIWGRDAVIAVQ